MITLLLRKQKPVLRSMENPNTPLSDPDDWLIDAWGGGPSAAGPNVSPKTSLKYSPVWRAVNLISRDVGKLPLFVYKRMGKGKERATDHAAYKILRYKPNRRMHAFIFKQVMTYWALLWGNAYAAIFKKAGKIDELIPMSPANTKAIELGDEGGTFFYLTKVGLKEIRLNPEEVFHLKNLGDGLEGLKTIAFAKDSIGLGLAAQEHGSNFFRHGARPSVVLEHPAKLSPEAQARLRNSWMETYGGLENHHKPAILEEAMKLHTFSNSNEDSQLLGLLQHNVRDVANWIGVPPHKLGDPSRTAYASLEQENQSYLDDSLDPWLVNWEEEARDKLLSDEEKEADSHVIEFQRNALVRANMMDRGNFYNLGLLGGWLNRDEVRGFENLNPIPEGEGEKFFMQLNLKEVGEDESGEGNEEEDGEELEEEESDEQDDVNDAEESERSGKIHSSWSNLFRDFFSRQINRITVHARKKARAGTLNEWVKKHLEEDHKKQFLDSIGPILEVFKISRGAVDLVPESVAARFFEKLKQLFSSCDTKTVESVCDSAEATFPELITEDLLLKGNNP